MFIEINDGIVVNADLITMVYKDEDGDGGAIRFANNAEVRVEGKSNIDALLTNLYVRKLSRCIIDRTIRLARETKEYSDKFHNDPETL